MSPQNPTRMIWVARGRAWGFRFLRDGGIGDPLALYEQMLDPAGDAPEFFARDDGNLALRFPDPEGRVDGAGRPISHDFILLDESADRISNLEEGIRDVWPLVAAEYARVWNRPEPPESRE